MAQTLRWMLWACLLLCCLGTAWADNSREIINAAEIEREKPANLMELLRKRGGLGDSSGALSLRSVPKVALYVDGFPRVGTVTEQEKIKPQRELGLVQGYDSLDSHYTRAIASGGRDGIDVRASFEDSLSNQWQIQRSDSPLSSLAQTQDTWFAKRGGDIKSSYRRPPFANKLLTGCAFSNGLMPIRRISMLTANWNRPGMACLARRPSYPPHAGAQSVGVPR